MSISWEEFEAASRCFSNLQIIKDIQAGQLKDIPLVNVQVSGAISLVAKDETDEIYKKMKRTVEKNDESLRLILEAKKEKLIADGESIITGFGDKVKELIFTEPVVAEVTTEA